MKIQVHIERLVLEGMPADRPQQLHRAFELELTRALRQGGLALRFRHPIVLSRAATTRMKLGSAESPVGLGQRLARAVYGSIGPEASDG
jgi:hypothetical protein